MAAKAVTLRSPVLAQEGAVAALRPLAQPALPSCPPQQLALPRLLGSAPGSPARRKLAIHTQARKGGLATLWPGLAELLPIDSG